MEPDPKALHRITLQLPVPVQDSKTLLKLLPYSLFHRQSKQLWLNSDVVGNLNDIKHFLKQLFTLFYVLRAF